MSTTTDVTPLSVCDVRKRYGPITAVDGLSFAVRRGECFALLGPNGAGKTTTLSMIASLIKPDQGQVLVNGVDVTVHPDVARRFLGVAPQELSLYDDLTGSENLAFFAGLYGLRGARLRERVAAALAIAGLQDRCDGRVGTYSGGMKRRLNLAAALVHEPSLVLLDEPTVGVDPQSRNHLFEMVAELKARDITIVYTTHYMEEAERLCDRIAIVDHGKLVALGTQAELVARVGAEQQLEVSFDGGAVGNEQLARVMQGLSHQRDGDRVVVQSPGSQVLPDVLLRCQREGVRPRTVLLRSADLETVFLRLTGRALRD